MIIWLCSTLIAILAGTLETMKAAVICQSGGPEALKIESRPIPAAKAGRSSLL